MTKQYPDEFKADVVAMALRGEIPKRRIAEDVGISETTLFAGSSSSRATRAAVRARAATSPPSWRSCDATNAGWRRRTRSCAARRATSPRTRSQNDVPLVRELAVDGVPVAVTCGVLGFSRQATTSGRPARWLTHDWDDAHLTNAIIDIHAADPEFGYRLVADELERLGWRVGENRVARLCREHGIASVITRTGRFGKQPGPAAYDDLVARDFAVDGLDRVWLTDLTEHPTDEGKLYVSAVADACSKRIVGYAMGQRMTARLAVAALELAIARRSPQGTVVVHSDRGSQFRSEAYTCTLDSPG